MELVAGLQGDAIVPGDWTFVALNDEAPMASTGGAQDLAQRVAAAVDMRLNALARSWRYSSYVSARSYRDDPNPRFAAEAAALIAHGSACWTVLDDLEVAVLVGASQMPETVDEVLALLPPAPTRPGI